VTEGLLSLNDRRRGPKSESTLSERCNASLIGSDIGKVALHQLETAGRDDERLHTYNCAPLLARPGLLPAEEVESLGQDISLLLDLLTSLPERLFDGRLATMCERVGIQGPARQAVLDTVDERSVVLARADVVQTASGPRAIELNIHSSLGGMDVGPLNETFLELPVYGDFLRAESLTYNDPLDSILAEVLGAAAERGITEPTVALVDWPSTYSTYAAVLERVCTLMRGRGVNAVHTHVGLLEKRDNHLWAGATRIDVLYRIFMLEDLAEQPDLIIPILDVHRVGNVLLAMSFFAELVGNKATLALLSQSATDDFLTAEERTAVQRILPQTCFLNDDTASWDGETCSVAELAVSRQRELVLKPAIGHGTLGVVPGWAVSEQRWAQAVQQAAGEVFVLQERVPAVPEPIPALTDGQWSLRDYNVNWGVFVHHGRYAGAMLRALPTSRPGIISLGTGGAVGCCFHQERSGSHEQ